MSTTIQTAVRRYLDERRQLGFDLKIAGQQLLRFARYADARHHRGALTLDIQLDWARHRVKPDTPITSARRLELLRPFVSYYRQFEPRSVIPDSTLFCRAHRRRVPHIYTQQEIVDLLQAAAALQPSGGLRPATYRTLFGLIAATGLRLSEAVHLNDANVDLRAATLTVRQTKFKKSRCLSLHPSTVDALRSYQKLRDRLVGRCIEQPFFVSAPGRALGSRAVHQVFVQLRRRLHWTARGEHAQPRIHDLRHTFAVRCIQRWQEGEIGADHVVFWLCTYLGHAKISDTYWYLTGVPELMAPVSNKFEQFAMSKEAHHG
jgi:integrase